MPGRDRGLRVRRSSYYSTGESQEIGNVDLDARRPCDAADDADVIPVLGRQTADRGLDFTAGGSQERVVFAASLRFWRFRDPSRPTTRVRPRRRTRVTLFEGQEGRVWQALKESVGALGESLPSPAVSFDDRVAGRHRHPVRGVGWQCTNILDTVRGRHATGYRADAEATGLYVALPAAPATSRRRHAPAGDRFPAPTRSYIPCFPFFCSFLILFFFAGFLILRVVLCFFFFFIFFLLFVCNYYACFLSPSVNSFAVLFCVHYFCWFFLFIFFLFLLLSYCFSVSFFVIVCSLV